MKRIKSLNIKLERLKVVDLPYIYLSELYELLNCEKITYGLTCLFQELRERKILFKPHVWISDDWFCPDGVSGFAIPFYLYHEKLIKFEKQFVGFVEGKTHSNLMRLLRHECAHALDNSFYLRKKKIRQKIFGLSSTPYPDCYSADLNSKNYVLNLEDGYAQSHPDEDWAETFAIWLDPKSRWQKKYNGWGAIDKLNYLDKVMQEIKEISPCRLNRTEVDSIKNSCETLKDYYDRKTEVYASTKMIISNSKMNLFLKNHHLVEKKQATNKNEINLYEYFKKHRYLIKKSLLNDGRIYRSNIDHYIHQSLEFCYNKNLITIKKQVDLTYDFSNLLRNHIFKRQVLGRDRVKM